MKWAIERDKYTYSAHRDIDCGFSLTIHLYVYNSIGDKLNPYRWSTELFRNGRTASYQMLLLRGRARTANDAKRAAQEVVTELIKKITKNK